MWIKIQQIQQYADIYSLQNFSTCFGYHSTHHQEYYKLYLHPPVHVILLVPLLPSNVYRRMQVQFLILLMMGAVIPETCREVLQWINICILLDLLDFLFTLKTVNVVPCTVVHRILLRLIYLLELIRFALPMWMSFHIQNIWPPTWWFSRNSKILIV